MRAAGWIFSTVAPSRPWCNTGADTVFNLFIWTAKSEIESATRTTSNRGYGVVYWSKFGLNFWVVSDLNVPDLREFARLLRDEPP